MPFRKSGVKLFFGSINNEHENYSLELPESPLHPVSCSARGCRKKKLWDQLSVISLSPEKLPKVFTNPQKTAPVRPIVEVFDKYKTSLSAPGAFLPFETEESDEDEMLQIDLLAQQMDNMGIKNPIPQDPFGQFNSFSGEEKSRLQGGYWRSEHGLDLEDEHCIELEAGEGTQIIKETVDNKRQMALMPQGVKAKLKYGGYIMAGFSLEQRSFSPSDVEYMKLCVKALESLFACK